MVRQNRFTRSAEGEDCTLRLSVCDPGPDNETVVLCHLNMFGNGGTKGPDYHAVYSCHRCHVVLDGPNRNHFYGDILRALILTQNRMIKKGLLPDA